MRRYKKIDIWIIIPVVILLAISITALFSINTAYFKSQVLSLCIALAAFFFFSIMDISFFRQLKKPIYIFSVIVLFLILAIGFESRGATRWLDIFGIRLQFSEILKPLLSLSLAAYLSENTQKSIKSYFFVLLFALPIILLIYFQPDLGNALMYMIVLLIVLLVRGYPLLWFGISLVPFLILSPLIWNMLHEYQRQRILTFLEPKSDPLGNSYNSIQSIIAVGSGSLTGKGLFEGTQSGLRFLPERHTDFMFASLSEGLGFIGAVIIVLSFFLLCYRIMMIFYNSKNEFTKIFAVCTFSFIFIQGFINMAMNMGYLPIVGITFPFISFGGSSLLANFIFLGILTSMAASERDRNLLEIK